MQVCEQSPDLGKESLVKQVYMSHAYTVAESGNEELHFRFMPDAEQVKQALQVGHFSC